MPIGVHLEPKQVTCRQCSTNFRCIGSRTKAQFCCNKCYADFRRSLPLNPIVCVGCKKTFVPLKKGIRYCSKQCAGFLRRRNLEKMQIYPNAKYAKRVLAGEQQSCSVCGWNDEPGILELHHKDRNSKNNHISNLQIMCPNCHSLEHYRAKDGQFSNNLGRSIKPKTTN